MGKIRFPSFYRAATENRATIGKRSLSEVFSGAMAAYILAGKAGIACFFVFKNG